MAQRDRVYPEAGNFPTAPPPPPHGAYYNMKDQQPIPPPATYRQRRRGRGPCCCFLLCLCSIFTVLVVLAGLAVLIFWLVVQPKAPKFEVNSVQISGITPTPPWNTSITYQITARNPNKRMGFYYSDINVFAQAQGVTVGQGSVPDFYQGHKNSTFISGKIGENGVSLDSSQLSALDKDQTNVPFYAQVDVKAKLKIGAIKTGKIKVKVKCNINADLTVTNGSQLKSQSCSVHW